MTATGGQDRSVGERQLCSASPAETLADKLPLRVIATFADGSVADVTSSTSVVYSSANPSVTSVNSVGMVAATGTGSTTVTATYVPQNLSASVRVSVSAPIVVVSPATLNFAAQAVGTTSAVQTVTVSNKSNGSLSVLNVCLRSCVVAWALVEKIRRMHNRAE